MRNFPTILLVYVVTVFFSCSPSPYSDPLTPQEALQSFHLREGFAIELFAAEPHVMDPVEMIFDERGNIFVVEMPDYPYKPEPGQAKGRIRKIMDTDGDGQVDHSVIFADSLSEATSIMSWKGGLIVTAAPHILYLKDTDNDHRADQREVLFSGFFENNSEAQITNLRFSVDNWIYAANFGQAGEVTFSRKPGAPTLSVRGADFRFRLDRGQFEPATGPTQFGQAIDDWGHRFMTQNTLHLRHAVIPRRYLHRHDYLPSTSAVNNVSDHDLEMFQLTPPPYWRAERTRRRQKSYDEQNLDRTEYAEDHFTGCSGSTFYTGDAFPEEYYGNVFTGDVAGNLVHRDILTAFDDSPTFVAKRDNGESDQEFLASTDPWFRPTSFTVGPDGYLYLIDYYRQHIETPLSIPEDLKEDMDFYNGSDRGRIYRIRPENASKQTGVEDLTQRNNTGLLALLSHPNQWYRLQAQRLLLERQDTAISAAAKELFYAHPDPRARLHALYVLEGLAHQLDEAIIISAMNDPHAGVREHGIILSEGIPGCLPTLLEKISDSSSRVAFQAVLSLGEFSGEQVLAALVNTLEKYGSDPWFRIAILSSQPGSSIEMLDQLAASHYFSEPSGEQAKEFLHDLSYIVAARNRPGEIDRLIGFLASSEQTPEQAFQLAGLKGLSEGLKKAKPEANISEAAKQRLHQITIDDETIKNLLQELKQ